MSTSDYHKTVIINRAVSGSGKTTMTRCITDALHERGITTGVHSTDEFFMIGQRYVFELNKLNHYHLQNLANFTADLERGIDVVICDNMNLLPWQSQPYTDAARKHNYRIIFLNFLPRKLEEHLAAQVVTPEKPDAHGLSRELLQRFMQNFNDYNDLLDRNAVRDIERHRVFVWNDIEQKAMDTGTLAQYFDADAVITIRPEDYDESKRSIDDQIWNLMQMPDEELKPRRRQKRYLLTWYGITDLCAALRLEQSDGPVMNALRTGNYTDVIILGYTNPNKSKEVFSCALRTEWKKLCTKPLATRLAYPKNKAQVMVDAVCNTENGHMIFTDFIKEAGLSAQVQFVPQVLSHVNDARGIDVAVRTALRLALSDQEEKDITCFLSSGTPLMAYTWAMISRTNPNLNLHMLVSSDSRKPPERVDLPKDVIVPRASGKQMDPIAFDVIIHLLGIDTNLPQYFSIVHFPAKQHWFIVSGESKHIEPFRRLLPSDATIGTKIVDPFITEHTRLAIEDIVQSLPSTSSIGLNLTGGTKLMFAGGLNASNEFFNTEPFYFDIKHHNFTFLRTDQLVPFPGVATIDGFFAASGYDITTPGYWLDHPVREARKEVTKKLWKKRNILNILYWNKDFQDYKVPFGKSDPPFDFHWKKSRAKLVGNKVMLLLDGETINVPDCTDFGTYLGGGWLEEYAYLCLEPLLKQEVIFDLRIGLKIKAVEQQVARTNLIYAECDCVFTDGKRLFIVECKAGEQALKQEHIQKLENNVKTYGGSAAKGFFVFSAPLKCAMHIKRISKSRLLREIKEEELNTETLKEIISS